MNNIVIFASGNGSNAENIIRHFRNTNTSRVIAVFSDNANAYVLQRAALLDVPAYCFTKNEFQDDNGVLKKLTELRTDLIVLAGFLKLMPKNILEQFHNRVINIHPALLPKYGGKGMYGKNVHEAVFAAHETETGITIHFVNEKYDDGEIILQQKVEITTTDTPQTIAKKVGELEYKYFPIAIEMVLARLV